MIYNNTKTYYLSINTTVRISACWHWDYAVLMMLRNAFSPDSQYINKADRRAASNKTTNVSFVIKNYLGYG